MNPFEMVVLIVALVTFAGIMKAKYSAKHRDGEAQDHVTAQENRRLHEELRSLKERMAVLERITVEKENSLEQEIERLRDR